MPDYAVSTAFTVQDHVTKAYKNMAKAAGIFEDRSARAFRKASHEASLYWNITKGIMAAAAIRASLSGVAQGVRNITASYMDFDDAAVAATVRFKDIKVDAAEVALNLNRIKMAAREAGAATSFTATEAAQALDFFARAGWKSEAAIGVLVSTLNLATASNTELALAADWSTDLLGAFGMNVDNVSQKIKNYKHLNDVLVATVNTANVTLEQLFETMKVGGPIATVAGASLEDVSAIAAIMANTGTKAERGATAIKNAFQRLSAPTDEVWRGFKKLNIVQSDVVDSTGKMKPIIDILAVMARRLEGVRQYERVGAIKEIFGAWAMAGTATLIENIMALKDYRSELNRVSGINEKTAMIMEQSIGRRLLILKSVASEAGIAILEAFRPDMIQAINNGADAIEVFNLEPLIKSLRVVVVIAGGMINAFRVMWPVMREAAVITGIYLTILSAAKLWYFVRALQAATVAQAAFNLVAKMNPYVLIGTAFIAITYLIIKNWNAVVKGLKIGLDYLVDFFEAGFFDIVRVFFDPLLYWIVKTMSVVTKFIGMDIPALGKIISDIEAREYKRFAGGWAGRRTREREAEDIHRAMTETFVNARNARTGRSTLDVNFRNAPAGTTGIPGENNDIDINVETMGVFP